MDEPSVYDKMELLRTELLDIANELGEIYTKKKESLRVSFPDFDSHVLVDSNGHPLLADLLIARADILSIVLASY